MRGAGSLARGCGQLRLLSKDCRWLANWSIPCWLHLLAGAGRVAGTPRGAQQGGGGSTPMGALCVLREAGWRSPRAAGQCLTWRWSRSFVGEYFLSSSPFALAPRTGPGPGQVLGPCPGKEWPQVLTHSSGGTSDLGNPDQLLQIPRCRRGWASWLHGQRVGVILRLPSTQRLTSAVLLEKSVERQERERSHGLTGSEGARSWQCCRQRVAVLRWQAGRSAQLVDSLDLC